MWYDVSKPDILFLRLFLSLSYFSAFINYFLNSTTVWLHNFHVSLRLTESKFVFVHITLRLVSVTK